jgi:hypothetical protein
MYKEHEDKSQVEIVVLHEFETQLNLFLSETIESVATSNKLN